MVTGLTITAFYAADVLLTATLLLLAKRKRQLPYSSSLSSTPSLSIMIPAFNEQANISICLNAILKSDYPSFEIIIVDDGSTDGTKEIIQQFEQKFSQKVFPIHLINNGGKVSALNLAAEHARGEILVTLDADTMVETDALSALVYSMRSKSLDAIGGFLKVSDPQNFLQYLQSLEYAVLARSRILASDFDIMMMLPGAFHAIRKDIFFKAGKYKNDTLAEDLDLALSILNINGKIGIETRAVAHTVAPKSLKQFYHQRYRWTLGTIQAYIKHRKEDKSQARSCYKNFAFPLQTIVYFLDLTIYFIQWPLFVLLILFSSQQLELAIDILIALIFGNITSALLINAMISQSAPSNLFTFIKQFVRQLVEKHFAQFTYFPLLWMILLTKTKNAQIWASWREIKNQSL